MNAPSDYPLLDRYLDGLTRPEEVAAVVEAVETDPDVLAWLRQATEIEAGLRFHLAGSSQPRRTPLRIVPFWHWRRAGKWCATAAAVAALAVCAAVFLWPQSSTSPGLHQLSSGMNVKRFAPGERSGAPLQAPELPLQGAMEEVEFRPGPKWLQLLRTTRISEPGDETSALPITEDQYLERYLRAAGVTFPGGSGLYWVLNEPAFIVINTPENIARITAMGEDPEARAPRQVLLEASLFRFGAEISPESLAVERILQPHEIPHTEWRAYSRSDGSNRFNFGAVSGEPVPGSQNKSLGPLAGVEVDTTYCRVGDYIMISGLAGTRPVPARRGITIEEYADTEFSVTLADEEAVVVHLGVKADGSQWIMVLQVRLVPLPMEITLDSVRNIMQSDPKLLEVKAGAPVRLTHRNTACVLQHNFVLVKPGKASVVGALADQLITASDALAKLYIPESPDIIVTGKKLLARGQSEVIEFTAPSEPGDYPWLCTFPGHWRLQQGILRVVK